jgi:hypothetical protein
MDAAYFNPKSIHVAKAEASRVADRYSVKFAESMTQTAPKVVSVATVKSGFDRIDGGG